MPEEQINTNQALKDAFAQLPKVIQDAITSADVEKRLRELATTHKLHVDQWSSLENEVMLTLLGFAQPSELSSNLQSEVGVPADEALALANDINRIVFDPIRQELERQLEHPEAKAATESGEDTARKEILAAAGQETAAESAPAAPETPPTPGVAPATPPAPKPEQKAVRAPVSNSYFASQASSERKSVDGDPYREMPL